MKNNRIKGDIYLTSIRTYDYDHVIVKFMHNDISYSWITSSHWKRASDITYINYNDVFKASWNDEGMDNYGTHRVASNVRQIK